jgi:hypothetical protein
VKRSKGPETGSSDSIVDVRFQEKYHISCVPLLLIWAVERAAFGARH